MELENGVTGLEFPVEPRDGIHLAAVGGARAQGILLSAVNGFGYILGALSVLKHL